jgi:hypothetical protein
MLGLQTHPQPQVNQPLWIQPTSYHQLEAGQHKKGFRMVLLQIQPLSVPYPEPWHDFHGKLQLGTTGSGLTTKQTQQIAEFLQEAWATEHCVVVQCLTGIGISTAVCEASLSLGYSYISGTVTAPDLQLVSQLQRRFLNVQLQ